LLQSRRQALHISINGIGNPLVRVERGVLALLDGASGRIGKLRQ
jgi:hypothetical protein